MAHSLQLNRLTHYYWRFSDGLVIGSLRLISHRFHMMRCTATPYCWMGLLQTDSEFLSTRFSGPDDAIDILQRSVVISHHRGH